MVMTISIVTQLLGIVTAIVLFARMRSTASALFLIGTLVIPVIPLLAFIPGIGGGGTIGSKIAAILVVGGPLCAGIGLLWHALTTPKPIPLSGSADSDATT